MPITPALARRLMQLPCLKKVPLGEKVELPQFVEEPREPPVGCTRATPSVRNPSGRPCRRGRRLRRVFNNLLLEETAEGDEFVADGVNHLKVVGSGVS